MLTREDGSPLPPNWISRRFKELAAEAGLPVIKFHAARHTVVSLMFEAKVDVNIVQEVLGHSTSAAASAPGRQGEFQQFKQRVWRVQELDHEDKARANGQ